MEVQSQIKEDLVGGFRPAVAPVFHAQAKTGDVIYQISTLTSILISNCRLSLSMPIDSALTMLRS